MALSQQQRLRQSPSSASAACQCSSVPRVAARRARGCRRATAAAAAPAAPGGGPWGHKGAPQPPCPPALPPRSAQPGLALQRGAADSLETEWDVLGLGQLMIDYSAAVDEAVLQELDVPKGGRRVISVDERAAVLSRLEAFESSVSPGGSLANTLVGLSRLAAAHQQRAHAEAAAAAAAAGAAPLPPARGPAPPALRVAMAGCLGGSDALGDFGRAQLRAAGVELLEGGGGAAPSAATGTVCVLTTADAQRSFLSSFADGDAVAASPPLLAAIARARLVVVEGYLLELPGAAEALPTIIAHARAAGTLVALSAGDAGVVARHARAVRDCVEAGVDLLLCNEAEAQALVAALAPQQPAAPAVPAQQQQEEQQQQQQQQQQADGLTRVLLDPQGSASLDGGVLDALLGAGAGAASVSSAQAAACQLADVCPIVVVTDGSRGSFITAVGELVVIPPHWRAAPPLDTCGAGDAHAAGLLFGLLLGCDLHATGQLAAKTASAVIARHAPQLQPGDADWVAAAPALRPGGAAAAARRWLGLGGPQRAPTRPVGAAW